MRNEMGINISRYFLQKAPAIQVPIVATVDALLTSSSHLLHHFARLVSQIEQGWWKEVPLTCALVIWLKRLQQRNEGQKDFSLGRWIEDDWSLLKMLEIFFSVEGSCGTRESLQLFLSRKSWGISGVLMSPDDCTNLCVFVYFNRTSW